MLGDSYLLGANACQVLLVVAGVPTSRLTVPLAPEPALRKGCAEEGMLQALDLRKAPD